jgi:acyl carrier protein
MQPLTSETHSPNPASITPAAAVIQVVTDLYTELHHSGTERPVFGLGSRLESDVGLDSLARVELLLRLEQRFDVHLADEALERFGTVADLVAAVSAAQNLQGQVRYGAEGMQRR